MIYTLDKTVNTKLHPDIPNCVLHELADNKRIDANENKLNDYVYRANIFKLISESEPTKVSYPFSQNDLSEVAAFLNPCPEIEWTEYALVKSFNLMMNNIWNQPHNIKLLDKVKDFGYPTPSKLVSITPAVCYNILTHMKVDTKPNTSFESMISILSYGRIKPNLIKEISLTLSLHSSSKLLSILMDLNNSINNNNINGSSNINTHNSIFSSNTNNDDIDYKRLSNICDSKISKKEIIGKSYVPTSKEEAIAAAAHFFSVDITCSSNPLLEYSNVVLHRQKSDPIMKELEDVNPKVFKLEYQFNPLLPLSMYSHSILILLLKKDNIPHRRDSSDLELYNLLTTKYTVDAFHYGVLNKPKSYETIIDLIDVRDNTSNNHSNNTIVSYGSVINGFQLYQACELYTMFETNRTFTDPESDVFSRSNILELKRICSKYCSPSSRLTTSDKIQWKRLHDIILIIEELMSNISVCMNELVSNYYTKYNDKEKTDVKELLYDVVYAALKMRGWDGKSKWPVTHVPSVDDTDKVALLSGPYVSKITEKAASMGKLGDYILKLPLLHISVDKEIYINSDPDRGLSIGDRLQIIKDYNYGIDSVHACVRGSSNYLLISGCMYLSAIGEVFSFDIHDIHTIH